MKSFAVFLAVLAVAAASVKEEWTSFKTSHGKKYSGEEEEIRYSIWEANKEMVEAHNAAGHSWTMAINEFSDWTTEEFEEKMLGYKPIVSDVETVTFDESIPRAQDIDFREEGQVTPVKNQGQCGSCWAFSATGAMEGMWKKKQGQLVSMSEQNLIDCGQGGCQGGLMNEAWETAKAGINSEADYPYEARDGQCRFDSGSQVAHTSGFQRVGHSESQVEAAVGQIGYPVSIAVHVGSSFQHYSGGVFSDPSCGQQQPNHGVLVVGYKKSEGTPFWIVKNSWGGSWGSSGYIYAKMGENFCGIDKDPMSPTV